MFVWSLPTYLLELSSVELGIQQISRVYFHGWPSVELMIARTAALSGVGSFAQAVTTWDKSCPKTTRICASICASPSEFPNESDVFRRFKSCRGHHFY